MGIGFLRKKEERPFLVLDIGTEAVKGLIVKKENNRNVILGAFIQYLETTGFFEDRGFGKGIIKKAVLEGMKEVEQGLSVSLKNQPIVLGLAPNILRARNVSQFFERERTGEKISIQEQKHIYRYVLEEAKKKISQEFAGKSGILPSEIIWINLKISAIKIDGYTVSGISRYSGRNLEFKILAIFLPKHYSENIRSIFSELGFGVLKITHIAENLSALFKTEETSGAFFDVGGEVSQIFLVKGDRLEEIFDFPYGGKAFSQELTERLGLNEDLARDLKEKYSNKLLNIETEERIRDIFYQEKINWDRQLKTKLLSSPVFLFGGGCLTPEVQDVFRKNEVESGFIYPKDFKNIDDRAGILTTPQYVPALLIIQ